MITGFRKGRIVMDMENFLKVAKEYNGLGWAVQDQLHKLDEDPANVYECNPNALKMISRFLDYAAKRGVEGTDYIQEAIEGYESDEGNADE